jgi:hypothetical protein
MKWLLFFTLICLFILADLGCKKKDAQPNVQPTLLDSLAGKYLVSGIQVSIFFNPSNSQTTYDTSRYHNDTIVYGKNSDSVLSDVSYFHTPYNYHPHNNSSTLYCLSFDFVPNGDYPGFDTTWFPKNDMDSIIIYYYSQATPMSHSVYHFYGRKIH